MKISVITPSVRPESLNIVYKCLERQTFKDFEWIVVGPKDKLQSASSPFFYVEEPPAKKGDYYGLNRSWNEAFRQAKGELIVSIVDGIWFPPDTLQKLWDHYLNNPKSCISAIGHQYDRVENGKPEHLIWRDPRARGDQGSFYETYPTEMELCVASFPKQMVYDVGGVDEEFDKYAALSEKEMMVRAQGAGYRMYLDQSIEYRAISHPRINKEWDEKYKEGCIYYTKCLYEIQDGKRLKLDFLEAKE